MEAVMNMPVLTKTYAISCALVTCLVMSKSISVGSLFLYFPLVFNRYRSEWWRLLGSFFVFDTKISVSWLLSMNLFVQHSSYLERSRYNGNTKAYALVWIYIMAGLLAADAILYYLGVPFSMACPPFLASSFSFVLEFMWARQNRNARVALLGFIVIRAMYLPIVLVGIAFLFGGNYILGWIVAHIYCYFTETLPELFADEKLPEPAAPNQPEPEAEAQPEPESQSEQHPEPEPQSEQHPEAQPEPEAEQASEQPGTDGNNDQSPDAADQQQHPHED